MMKYQKGFGLLELLIAIALGTALIAGFITVYLSIKINHNRQQAFLDLQDAERFANTFLSQRIRIAGFVGCADTNNPVDQNQAIVGYSSDRLPSFLQNQVIANTEAVVVKACISNTEMAQNTTLTTMGYYIGNTNRNNLQGQPILALFQKPIDGDREELAAGVEQMQILYGVLDTTTGLMTYYKSEQIADWQTVRILQIDLLFNSVDAVLKKPQAYDFLGQTTLPNDLLLHQPWRIHIALRER
jgi:prepilin-type N-terminal cleavage/methylation domain-containing protein